MSRPYFELESLSGIPRFLGFAELGSRLIQFVASRIRNGDYTERGLARILDVSQPQLHNVLKGARPLRPDLADHMLRYFQISVLDLAYSSELTAQIAIRGVGQGFDWSQATEQIGGHILPGREVPAKPAGRETSCARPRQNRLVS
jgi:hypothetical protein